MESKGKESVEFDIYKVRGELNNDYEKKIDIKDSLFISLLPKELQKEKDPNYFVKIQNKNQKYIGALNSKFQKDYFAYILFAQGDEYLGELSKEQKNGFGIYKYNTQNKGKDIYIGNFNDNKIVGKGIYINIINYDKDKINNNEKKENKSNNEILTEFKCYIGNFEEGIFKNGKIYTCKNEFEKLEFKDEEEKEKKEDKNGKEVVIVEKKEGIYIYSKSLVKDKTVTEGVVINFNENEKIVNKYTFKINEHLKYDFGYLKDGKKEEKILKDFKTTNFIKYKTNFQEIITKIDDIINKMEKDNNYAKFLNNNDDFKMVSDYANALLN